MHQTGSHQHRVISVGGHPAHHQLDGAGGRGRVYLPHHCAAALPAELPHGAGRGVGGLLVGSVGGAGAVKVAVGQVVHLEDLPQGGVGDVDSLSEYMLWL